MVSPRIVLLIFIVLVFGACAAVIVPLERHYADDPLEKARRGEIEGLDPLSMLRAANATHALREVAERSPAEVRIQDLTIRPASVALSVEIPAEGSRRTFTVDPGFGVSAGNPTDASSDSGATFRGIDGGAPERMALIVLGRLHRPAEALDYVVASIPVSAGDKLSWLLFLKGGRVRDRAWRADADGANVRRNGT